MSVSVPVAKEDILRFYNIMKMQMNRLAGCNEVTIAETAVCH